MANAKISALTALTGAGADATADVLAVVDTSATTTKKMLFEEFVIGVTPSQATLDAGASTKTVLTPALNRIALGTETSASGATMDYTGFPAGTRLIRIMLVGLSSNGTSNYLIQLGDAGGFETTGYVSGAHRGAQSATSTAGFIVSTSNNTTATICGVITLILEKSSTFQWVSHGVLSDPSVPEGWWSAGYKALSQELTQIRITTVNGTDTFDAGFVNVQYER